MIPSQAPPGEREASMTMPKRVLVTGSSGRIGRAVVAELTRRGHHVRGFDRVAHAGLNDQVIGSLTDPASVAKAMAGIETLIHLAATPDDDDFLKELLPNNVVGVYHVLETAQQAGVKRLILASSGQVVWYERLRTDAPIRVDTQPTPRYWYAACKMFLEAAGRAFAEKFGQEVLAIRLGWCPRDKGQEAEIAASDWAPDVYLSPGDAGRFFACCVEADSKFSFQVLYATSKPVKRPRLDLEPTGRLVGFEPRERWPEGLSPL